MPEAAIATGDVQAVHPLSDLAAAIMRHLAGVGGLV
jgi:chemotaxis response regulator CheB